MKLACVSGYRCTEIHNVPVFTAGFGQDDVENAVPCTADSVMKIASISKPITMAILARQWERGCIDIDAPIGRYVTTWPRKTWNGKEVRHMLLCLMLASRKLSW